MLNLKGIFVIYSKIFDDSISWIIMLSNEKGNHLSKEVNIERLDLPILILFFNLDARNLVNTC